VLVTADGRDLLPHLAGNLEQFAEATITGTYLKILSVVSYNVAFEKTGADNSTHGHTYWIGPSAKLRILVLLTPSFHEEREGGLVRLRVGQLVQFKTGAGLYRVPKDIAGTLRVDEPTDVRLLARQRYYIEIGTASFFRCFSRCSDPSSL
jgi:hypothetical protein